ncbi:cache domain-containing protein [Massilia yuzhufengensis]|uniref:histidine kinase n=1 Tax=Massilia yuzhufengensis TaxID=1164594 RepID=A0A1I1JV49_9BURK|nr:cache domain-containing protein [Massilia yuzhufengensis]SFC52396.1 signal transduction histidine kinase [Massilia yuzhufengensis]
MRLRQKVIVLAIAPLIVALCAIALFVRQQATELAHQQRATIQRAYLASKESELRHYVALASQSIGHLVRSGRRDPATLAEAQRILASLSFGDDGYFFVYDMQGKSLMHPRQPELVGTAMWDWKDATGTPTIQRLIERARAGGGFHRYTWAKPSSKTQAPKLGYVVPVADWGWVMGTGIYLDDVEAALAQVDAQQSRNIEETLLWIAGLAILSSVAVASGGLVLNLRELRVADAKLKALAQRVVESQEEERARLSRDLHDGISQALVSVKLQLEAGIIRLAGSEAQQQAARAGLDRTVEQVKSVLGEVRRISHDLRPALLDDLGLAPALDHLASEFGQHAGTPVRFRQEGGMDALPEMAGTVLFRIAQEALTNAERHAGARHIEMSLERRGRCLTLSIVDDGGGFDADSIAVHPQRGIGLRNMMERMEAIGGRLAIDSSPLGTRVVASIDLKEQT